MGQCEEQTGSSLQCNARMGKACRGMGFLFLYSFFLSFWGNMYICTKVKGIIEDEDYLLFFIFCAVGS